MKARTVVVSNGSKWAGQAPDPISMLEERLATEPLDPRWEHYGQFVAQATVEQAKHYRVRRGTVFFGNFLLLSATFQVITNDAALVERLKALIAANMQRADYVAARTVVLAACNCVTCRPDPARRKEGAA